MWAVRPPPFRHPPDHVIVGPLVDVPCAVLAGQGPGQDNAASRAAYDVVEQHVFERLWHVLTHFEAEDKVKNGHVASQRPTEVHKLDRRARRGRVIKGRGRQPRVLVEDMRVPAAPGAKVAQRRRLSDAPRLEVMHEPRHEALVEPLVVCAGTEATGR